MKAIHGLWVLSLVVLSGTSALAQARRPNPNFGEQGTVEVDIRRWRSDLVSELRFSVPGTLGSDFDPVADLGLPAERAFDYHVAVRVIERLRIRFNWFRLTYNADTVTSESLLIGGDFYESGSVVTSFLELEQRRGGVEFDLVRGEYGWLAVVGEWARFEANNAYESTDRDTTISPLRMSLPLFGIKTRIYLTPALAVSVEGLGMKREAIGVMTDFDTSVTYNAIPNLAFSYGYRNSYNRFKENEPTSRSIYRLRGQYFGITVRF
ncbi:MAG: hypothetical protein BMS9Abin37_0889 [Acidobacteriota bacterium]|nr:MAG: hypothetical protein BMS9Abin37_0889 [Acidobacteriota bacterium]